MGYDVRFFKKAINFGFGALLLTKENVEEIIDDLVKKGEIKTDEAKAQVKEIFNKVLSGKKKLNPKSKRLWRRCFISWIFQHDANSRKCRKNSMRL